MGFVGYAAMFEQFHPTDLLRWSRQAEDRGFGGIMASDHFQPWTRSAGTGRFRLGMDGRARRDDEPRPLRHRRDGARLPLSPGDPGAGLGDAGGDVSRSLLPGHRRGRGAQRTHRRRVLARGARSAARSCWRASRSSRSFSPASRSSTRARTSRWRARSSTRCRRRPAPIYIATSGPVNSERTGRVADGIITVGAADEKIQHSAGALREGRARRGQRSRRTMPRILQLHVSWADSREAATEQAVREWPNGGMAFPKADIRNPEDFARHGEARTPGAFRGARASCRPTSASTRRRSSTSSISASTRSTSTTSGATRRRSSRRMRARCCPPCAGGKPWHSVQRGTARRAASPRW